MKDPGTADRMLDHLNSVSKTIRAREVARRMDGDYTAVTIEKTFVASTSRIRDLLAGVSSID